MEACATAHHWARQLIELGHEVKLMPPHYVKPYVKRGKNCGGRPGYLRGGHSTNDALRIRDLVLPHSNRRFHTAKTRSGHWWSPRR
jgi:hypothetical protein